MREKNILILGIITLIIAFFALSFREAYLANPAHHDWWSLSFVSPESTDGSFLLSNFGPTRTFFYEATFGNTVATSASLTMNNAGRQEISIQNPNGKPVHIKVWVENDKNKENKDLSKKKEIYKR